MGRKTIRFYRTSANDAGFNRARRESVRHSGFGVSGILTLLIRRPRGWVSQRLQNPLMKEYTLNYIRVPIIVSGIFLN